MISGEAAQSRILTVLWHPRPTIRRIVDRDPRERVLSIVAAAAMLSATAWLLLSGASIATVPTPFYPTRLLLIVLAGPLAIGVLYLEAGLVRWAGGLIGGTASPAEVRAAIAWARIPAIVGSLAMLTLMAFGFRLLPDGSKLAIRWVPPLGAIFALFAAWELILATCTIAEVNRFTRRKALAACAIAALTFFGAATVGALSVVLAALPFLGY